MIKKADIQFRLKKMKGNKLRKIIVCSLFCSLAFANNLEILQKDKKELRQLDKKSIESNYELTLIGEIQSFLLLS